MKGSKHALNWTTLLIAVPVGGAASLVTLLFRETIEFINYLLFGRSNDITESIHLWPMLFWPVLVGVGGLLAGFFPALRGRDRAAANRQDRLSRSH